MVDMTRKSLYKCSPPIYHFHSGFPIYFNRFKGIYKYVYLKEWFKQRLKGTFTHHNLFARIGEYYCIQVVCCKAFYCSRGNCVKSDECPKSMSLESLSVGLKLEKLKNLWS